MYLKRKNLGEVYFKVKLYLLESFISCALPTYYFTKGD